MGRWCAGENLEAAVPSLETAAPFGSFRRLRPAFCQRQGGDVLRGCRVYRKLDKHSVKKRQGVCRFFYVIFFRFCLLFRGWNAAGEMIFARKEPVKIIKTLAKLLIGGIIKTNQSVFIILRRIAGCLRTKDRSFCPLML